MDNYIARNLPRLSQNKRRPAECAGIQIHYAEEMARLHNNGLIREQDIEFVFQNHVLSADGTVTVSYTHLTLPTKA